MYHYDPEEQQLFCLQFGKMLRQWRKLNHWTQYTAYDWAKEAGFHSMAPSTLCVLEQGKAPKPRAESFFAFGETNYRLFKRDYSGVTSKALRDLIFDADPLVGNDGRVWTPADFWSCHCGLISVPDAYR